MPPVPQPPRRSSRAFSAPAKLTAIQNKIPRRAARAVPRAVCRGRATATVPGATCEGKSSAPTYSLIDRNPKLSSKGKLLPFASSGPTGLTPAQLRHAYGVDNIKFGAIVGDGSGQTIAIVDAYDYPTAAADLHAFDQQFGLPDPPSFTKVNQTGGSTLPGTDPAAKGNDWELEEALDIEWTHAIAPGANIILVEANSAFDSDLITAAGRLGARGGGGVGGVDELRKV